MRASTVAALLVFVGFSLALSPRPSAADDDGWRDEDRQEDDRPSEDQWNGDQWGGRPDHRHDHQIIVDHSPNGGRQIDAPLGRQPIPPMRPYWGTMGPYWKPVEPRVPTHGTGMHHRSK